MKVKDLRIGMNVRFRDSENTAVYKIIGRDKRINSRFTIANGKFKDEDGYFMTINYIHENELERA
jgi:hypothetical protein